MLRRVALLVLAFGLTLMSTTPSRALARDPRPSESSGFLSGGYRVALEGCTPPYCGQLPPNESNIFLENLNGNGRRRVTNGELLYFTPSWSPDGSRVAVMGTVGEFFDKR